MAIRRLPGCTVCFTTSGDPRTRGHLLTATLHEWGNTPTLRVVGVYYPCSGTDAPAIRASITAALGPLTADRTTTPTITVGDMNAALYPGDRAGSSQAGQYDSTH